MAFGKRKIFLKKKNVALKYIDKIVFLYIIYTYIMVGSLKRTLQLRDGSEWKGGEIIQIRRTFFHFFTLVGGQAYLLSRPTHVGPWDSDYFTVAENSQGFSFRGHYVHPKFIERKLGPVTRKGQL